jgi:hypothetical protein
MHWQRCTKPWPKKPKKSDCDPQFAILLIHGSPCRGKGLAAFLFLVESQRHRTCGHGNDLPRFRTSSSSQRSRLEVDRRSVISTGVAEHHFLQR